MSAVDLTLLIPAFNESSIIISNIDELSLWMDKNQPDMSYEIVVVDDGSTDGMGTILEDALAAREWLRVIHHPHNMGRGKGVRSGFENSSGRYIICLDSDLSYEPGHIMLLLAPLLKGEADITLASAHHPDGQIINVPFQRKLLSKLGNWIMSKGLKGKHYTVTCIVRGFTREVADELELVNNGKELHLEVIQKAQLAGYRIKEVPAVLHWRDRKRGRHSGIIPEMAVFKMRKTVLSHLVFNYITNPGIILFIPIVFLLVTVVVGSGMIIAGFISELSFDLTLMQTLRQTLIDGQLTLVVVFFAFITFIVFIVFYFLSFQNKRYFDDLYTTLMRMNNRLRKLERKG